MKRKHCDRWSRNDVGAASGGCWSTSVLVIAIMKGDTVAIDSTNSLHFSLALGHTGHVGRSRR